MFEPSIPNLAGCRGLLCSKDERGDRPARNADAHIGALMSLTIWLAWFGLAWVWFGFHGFGFGLGLVWVVFGLCWFGLGLVWVGLGLVWLGFMGLVWV